MHFNLLEPISVHGFSVDLLRELREELTLHLMQTLEASMSVWSQGMIPLEPVYVMA